MRKNEQEGKMKAFLKSCTMQVLADGDAPNLEELNKDLDPAERGGGRGIAMAKKARDE